MIESRIEWHGVEAQEQVRLVLLESLTRATVWLWTRLQEILNVPNTGERRKSRYRKTKSGRAATYTVYPHPSKPGEPPRKRTGWGQRNVQYAIDRAEGVGRVGVTENAAYMAYLELGTKRIQPRPWLVATVEKHRDEIAAQLFTDSGG